MLAPIVLFIYDRPEHTLLCLEALKANELADECQLYIYADGPKPNASWETQARIVETRKMARKNKWCKSVEIIENDFNRGLAASIVSGVTEVVNKHGRVIVLEDDIITRHGFLRFMNDALDLYENEEKVMQVSGYIYPYGTIHLEKRSCFLKIMACWGWATWKRAWEYYIPDTEIHVRIWKNNSLIKKFNIEGGAYFFEQLLENNSGKINTWAVKWYSSWLMQGGYSLYPQKSLVRNIGMDNSGVHCQPTNVFDGDTIDNLCIGKIQLKENIQIRKAIDRFFRENVTGKKRFSGAMEILLNLKSILRPYYHRVRKLMLGNKQQYLPFNSEISPLAKLYPPFTITETSIGDYTYVAFNSHISKCRIGKFCSIGPNFFCGYGIHPLNGISTSPMFYSTRKQNGFSLVKEDKIEERKEIIIGNDVFIGVNVTILDGIKISDGAIIGAGAVVTSDVPPYAIVGGVPAKILSYRFNDEIIGKLLALQWWEGTGVMLADIERNFFRVDEFINNPVKDENG